MLEDIFIVTFDARRSVGSDMEAMERLKQGEHRRAACYRGYTPASLLVLAQ